MTSIALTLATRASLESLQLTTAAANETSIRLGTGRKVNTALDNPSAFFTSRSLNARATELNNVSDGFSNAIKTLEADANAVKATGKLLDQMEALAKEARKNAAEPDEVSKAILGHSFASASDNITTVPSLAGKRPYLTVWAPGETPVTHSFASDGGTVQDLINTINGAANGVTASFNATTGKIELDGGSKLALTLGGFEGTSGLTVSVYQGSSGIGNIAQAEAAAANSANYLGQFQTTAIDYPTGGGNDFQVGRLRSFVGADGSAFVDAIGDPHPDGPVVNRMVFVIEGVLNIPAGGAQAYDVYSDDGFEIRVDGAVVAAKDGNQAPQWVYGSVPSNGGQQNFRLIYWENGGAEALYVAAKDQNGNQVPIAGDLIPVIDAVEPSTGILQARANPRHPDHAARPGRELHGREHHHWRSARRLAQRARHPVEPALRHRRQPRSRPRGPEPDRLAERLRQGRRRDPRRARSARGPCEPDRERPRRVADAGDLQRGHRRDAAERRGQARAGRPQRGGRQAPRLADASAVQQPGPAVCHTSRPERAGVVPLGALA